MQLYVHNGCTYSTQILGGVLNFPARARMNASTFASLATTDEPERLQFFVYAANEHELWRQILTRNTLPRRVY